MSLYSLVVAVGEVNVGTLALSCLGLFMVKGKKIRVISPTLSPTWPSHQDGAHVCLKNCHLVIDAVIAVTKGTLQGLPAPERHTLKHGDHTCLKGRRAQDSRRDINKQGAGWDLP